MSERAKRLFRVDVERTEQATIYVEATDLAEAKAQVDDGLTDALTASDWFQEDDEDTEVREATHSNGNVVWSGWGDGHWNDPWPKPDPAAVQS